MDQETGEDLNPTGSRQHAGGEISEMARNPDRYCSILPIKLYSVWSTFIFSYNFITFIYSGDNSIKTNFECATEVKTGSHVGVSQSEVEFE